MLALLAFSKREEGQMGHLGLFVLCAMCWLFLAVGLWWATLVSVVVMYLYLCGWFYWIDKKERTDESV